MAGLIKRSFALAGHRTSVALEAEFWAVLAEEAGVRGVSLAALVAGIDGERDPAGALASALRLWVLAAVRARSRRASE